MFGNYLPGDRWRQMETATAGGRKKGQQANPKWDSVNKTCGNKWKEKGLTFLPQAKQPLKATFLLTGGVPLLKIISKCLIHI